MNGQRSLSKTASVPAHQHTTTIPADIIEAMKLIRNDGNGGRDNCTVQRNEKYGEAEREPIKG